MSTEYLECVVNDRGFVNKPAQVTEIAPTLRAERQGLKVLEENGGDDMNEVNQPGIEVIGMLENSGTTQQHNNRVHSVDGISPTLTAVSGGTHHIKIFDVSKYRVRKLTPTEYGRLQAFPVDDGWEQVVSDSQAYHQFGNAVTVSVVAAIGGAIRNYLDDIFGAEEETEATDLSDAPEEIKEQILENAELLERKEENTVEVHTSGLEFFTNEELLAELNRRMSVRR